MLEWLAALTAALAAAALAVGRSKASQLQAIDCSFSIANCVLQ
jgi:hypothetical protein